MRHIKTITAATLMASAMCMISCNGTDPVSPDPEPTPSGEKSYLDASIENYKTRTVLVIDGTAGKTEWELGDQIKVYPDDGNGVLFGYAFPKGSDAAVGRFFTETESFQVGTAKVAYYPGENATTVVYSSTDKTITASVPSTQTYVKDSFGPGAAPMVSNVYNDKKFNFKNVFGGVIIPLYDANGGTVTGIDVTSTSTLLSGDDFKFVLGSGNAFTVTPPTSNTGKTITMSPNVAIGTTSATATKFCFMMPGLADNEKVTVKIKTASQTFTKTFTVNKGEGHSTNVLTANHILSLSPLEIGAFIDFSVEVAGWDKGGSVETLKME